MRNQKICSLFTQEKLQMLIRDAFNLPLDQLLVTV